MLIIKKPRKKGWRWQNLKFKQNEENFNKKLNEIDEQRNSI